MTATTNRVSRDRTGILLGSHPDQGTRSDDCLLLKREQEKLTKAPRGMRIRSPKIAIPNLFFPPSVISNRIRDSSTMTGKLPYASRMTGREHVVR